MSDTSLSAGNRRLRAATNEPAGGLAFRPASRRRARVAVGVGLAAAAIGGNVLVYRALGDTTAVLQVVSAVRAGQQVSATDLRVVDIALDPTVPVVLATDIGRVVDQYARVHLIEGTLIVAEAVQPDPLVSAGHAVVSLEMRATRVPSGLRERSSVLIVHVTDDPAERWTTEGRVVARGDADDAGELVAVSVEVEVGDAPRVAAATDVRLALLDPDVDAAMGEVER